MPYVTELALFGAAFVAGLAYGDMVVKRLALARRAATLRRRITAWRRRSARD